MQIIKLIDLLNKIANGEEAPKKIKYKNLEYEYKGKSYIGGFDDDLFMNVYCNDIDLNEEVEMEIVERRPVTVEEVEKDLKYVLNRILKAFERNDCIDWNFTDIRKKYGFDYTEEDE